MDSEFTAQGLECRVKRLGFTVLVVVLAFVFGCSVPTKGCQGFCPKHWRDYKV